MTGTNNTHTENTPTRRIDALRRVATDSIQEQTKGRYEHILSIDSTEELSQVLSKVFPANGHKIFRDFFIVHSIAWTDILRKLHTYRKYDNTKGWYIDEKNIGELYTPFLIRGRASDIGEKLRKALPDAITQNKNLLQYASEQPSILDEGGYMFSKIPKRKNAIKKFISLGLIQNIEGCTYDNIDIYLVRIFPKILMYVESIFGISLPLGHCKNLEQTSRGLEKMFSTGVGTDRENAFRVIQAMHAWGGIEDIEKMHGEAISQIAYIPEHLSQKRIQISNIFTTQNEDVTIYSGICTVKGKICRLEWRIKTIKSILQKMWETEEYTNADAIRDVLGMAIIYPDGTPIGDRVDIISTFATLMPNFGYILKDKGGLGDDISTVESNMKEKKKNPAYISTKKGASTSEEFKNTSLSGYLNINSMPIGTEVQMYSESFATYKKIDDKKYKPKGTIGALMRGPAFATTRQIYTLLNKRTSPEDIQKMGYDSLYSMFVDMINGKFLLPYISGDGKVVLFTHPEKEDIFKLKFPSMYPLKTGEQYHQNMLNFVASVFLPENSTSTRTPSSPSTPVSA